MGRRNVEVRREEILVATIAGIEKSGMSAVRVSDIAAGLGVSSGLVFYHFDTKDALLVEALEYAVVRDADRLDKALAAEGGPLEPGRPHCENPRSSPHCASSTNGGAMRWSA
jgi:AcrR family transcriptional regulator